MRNEAPSATAATTKCPRCGGLMIIRLVEPRTPAERLERHTFKCTSCSLSQGYLVDPTPPVPARSARPRVPAQ
jgi:predicted RNA-binding Zn-ribbon protein involved in translation (DUF1610 family)